ncbi:ParB-like partition protein OS=Tsukamurella paurometabola (strain ATCC 8368 / DSM / CCUG 35730/ CIP 100753 / JCM 10117 / KCTC 9821 / NBRC 16120 / NCIMB 702349 / NCTC 13040) OX=521096 GN=Tpau_4236 PE=3 SV=1 [Tsukamurella paurometabola]|uniref:ParB-like partition protein n=1 Tax=Tsukamurella paurometabola (strain ATCC 8368 / DSM 20162 / CCUG 35730 / CIP 100753 / JCM 10117 / KCTC 9821 / NBRC 16120 / NCIMB 702349 / NCTC 13040) TaxID=521096 RepID=D5UP95_TSUPD|nr:ParB/RepB/Spo0J family partition protein [Tsukamurella paurometabola]ADG80804.1 parB-like partition protein [Tsukamurella paurometabola DSM 20162]SUP41050.1 Probable chromosome-partitioning protein parB [Tsukamurella paurometabola]
MATQKKGGLGRGLAALIPTGPDEGPRLGNAAADVVIGAKPGKQAPSAKGTAAERATGAGAASPGDAPSDDAVGAVYRELAPSAIQPNPQQPRSVFDEEALAELVHSIREFGLMQPIVVRPLPRPQGEVRYQLVMGERRWRASQEAGLETIPTIVRETADGDMLRDALLENIHRVQLNPLEEAAAYQQLLEEFGVTHDELAARLGRSRPVVTNTIRLLRLPVAVQRRVAAGVLSAGHARALLALEGGTEAQEALAARIIAEGMSVRATEEAVTLANRDGTVVPPAPKRRQEADPGLRDVADRIADRLDTKVTVSMGKRKGKIVVEVGSADDLERIVGLLSGR